MWGFGPLLALGMADIPVLHSAKVAHLYPQEVFPFYPVFARLLDTPKVYG
jgi:hypothetical protein